MSNYNVRSNVTSNYWVRPVVVTYDYITWNESIDTWNSVTETWETYYNIIQWSVYNTRNIVNSNYTTRPIIA